jgi:DNA-directed RNA polymerase specialized sigma24 family protein
MSKLAELSYDIEQLYIDGFSPSRIAKILDCPLGIVYDWLEEQNVAEAPQEEDFNPFSTVNS